MRMFWRGVSLDQQKSATVEKRLRKLLQPEHYNNTIVCLDPENETSMRTVTPEMLLSAAEGCHVTDKTDGRPLADKLRQFRDSGASVLVIDAVDDEPFVTSASAVVKWKQKAFLLAADCLRRAYGFEQTLLVVYARGVYDGIRLPEGCGVTLKKLRCKYPARIRLHDMYDARRCAVVGAEALLHLYRALYNAKMQDSTIVTVAGTAVGAPCNVEVTVGTPVSALLDLCGLTCPPAVLVRGGAMTGRAMTDASEPVQPGDTAFLAFAEPIRKRQYGCVGCGRCSRVCPCDLMPESLYKNASAGFFAACDYLKVDKCIECGCCSYICPSNIDLLSYIRKAKDRLYGQSPDAADAPDAPAADGGSEEEPYGAGDVLEELLRRQSLTGEPDPEERYEPKNPPRPKKRRSAGKSGGKRGAAQENGAPERAEKAPDDAMESETVRALEEDALPEEDLSVETAAASAEAAETAAEEVIAEEAAGARTNEHSEPTDREEV